MFWEAKATLVDRQRGVATFTAACAEKNVVLLELRTDQHDDGRFTDAVVLAAPGSFTAEDVVHLFAGVDSYGDITAVPVQPDRLGATDHPTRRRRRRAGEKVAFRGWPTSPPRQPRDPLHVLRSLKVG
jgi:hypothetical protein